MIQEQIYEKPIDRNIEGVIKASDDKDIKNEVEEYVITDELAGKSDTDTMLPGLFAAMADPNFNQDVWISGDFGSGKSHLLKILSVVLSNKQLDDKGEMAAEVFEKKAAQIPYDPNFEFNVRKVAKIPTKTILFNIQDLAEGIKGKRNDQILQVFLSVFNDMQGYCKSDPAVADIEREIDRKGKLQYLKDEFQKRYSKDWMEERTRIFFNPKETGAIYGDIFGMSAEEGTERVKALQKSYTLSIDGFTSLVKEYLDKQENKNFRLVFCVDEIGQFIAKDISKMLSLQTIAEGLAVKTGGKAFIIVTSQVDMNAAIGDLDGRQEQDFSRIQGRFTYKINLTSANADEVIQKRLLRKNTKGTQALAPIFDREQSNMKVFFNFGDDTRFRTKYRDSDQFIDSFPFVGYQFDLLKASIVSLSKNNAFSGTHQSVGERSMISICQKVACKYKDEDLNHIVQFGDIYEGVKPTLQTKIIEDIITAENNLDDELAIKVLKSLFLVKYVDGFKATVDNITKMLIPTFDTDLHQFTLDVQTALNKLEHQTYIERLAGDEYSFLTDKEKDIENKIKEYELDPDAVTKELQRILFDDLYDVKKVNIDNDKNKNFDFGYFIDGQQVSKGDRDIYLHVITPLYDGNHDDDQSRATLSIQNSNHLMVFLGEYRNLKDDLTLYLKAKKQLNILNAQNNDPVTNTIIANKMKANSDRYADIVARLRQLLSDAILEEKGNILNISSKDIKARLNEGMQELVRVVYVNLQMLKKNYDVNMLHTILFASNMTKEYGLQLEPCDQDVNNEILRNNADSVRSIVRNVVDHFRHGNYGWYEMATLCILAKLYRLNMISFIDNGAVIENPQDIENHLTNSLLQQRTSIKVEATISQAQVNALTKLYQYFSDKPCTKTDAKDVHLEFMNMINEKVTQLRELKSEHHQKFTEALDPVIDKLQKIGANRYSYAYTHFSDLKDDLEDMREDIIEPIEDFVNNDQQMRIFSSINTVMNGNQENLKYVDSEVMNRLNEAYHSTTPWRNMAQAKADLAALRQKIDEVRDDKRQDAINAINEKIADLESMDIYQQISDDDKKSVEKPLLDLLEEVVDERFINTIIIDGTSTLNQRYDKAINTINDIIRREILRKQEDERQQEANANKTSGSSQQVLPQATPRTYARYTDIISNFDYPKSALKTQSDVDEFIDALNAKLSETIKKQNILLR